MYTLIIILLPCKNILQVMGVLNPLKIILSTVPDEKSVEVFDFPFDPTRGSHLVTVSQIMFIDRSDFRLVDDADYFGLAPGKFVGLKYLFVIKCDSYELDANGKYLLF